VLSGKGSSGLGGGDGLSTVTPAGKHRQKEVLQAPLHHNSHLHHCRSKEEVFTRREGGPSGEELTLADQHCNLGGHWRCVSLVPGSTLLQTGGQGSIEIRPTQNADNTHWRTLEKQILSRGSFGE